MPTAVNPPCSFLEWDSAFFKTRIARVTSETLDHQDMQNVLLWCGEHSIRCLYLLAAVHDATTTRLAEAHDFHLADLRVTLGLQLSPGSTMQDPEGDHVIRPCREDDLPALRALARASHHDSRFYQDPNFPQSACDALYETWIDKSCHGYAEAVFVLELSSEPMGYISCHRDAGGAGHIGLFAVAKSVQGKGYGRALIGRALQWFLANGLLDVSVVTQGRNVPAQRVYQRCGFTTRSLHLWYHRWFEPIPESCGANGDQVQI